VATASADNTGAPLWLKAPALATLRSARAPPGEII